MGFTDDLNGVGTLQDRDKAAFGDDGANGVARKVKTVDSGLVFGRDYDEVDDSTIGLVQTIIFKLATVTVQTVTITYTDECKDQYNLVVT
jgi:hypothetical protein